MLAAMTDTKNQDGEVSQWTGPIPSSSSPAFTRPDSLLRSQAHVDADTMSGSSQGTRNRARRVAAHRNPRAKNTAIATPITYLNASDASVKTSVFTIAVLNSGTKNTKTKKANPTSGAPPGTNVRAGGP